MRQRIIVGTKLAETLARGVFVLVCTYRLPVVEAGRFGLAATLVGIAAFVLGYERHIELLRNAAGRSTTDVRWRLRDALRFFALHAAWVLPAFAALLAFALGWPAHWVALLALIALSEHLSNQGYIAVLLDGSHYPLLAAVAVKNGVLALAVVALALLAPQHLNLDLALHLWAAAGLAYLLVAAALWTLRLRPQAPVGAALHASVAAQYRSSRVLFSIGLVALAALQADRLVASSLLSPFDVGVYFRNVTLAGLALQLFNIVSYNRVAPGVYAHARKGDRARALSVVRIEYRRFAVALVVLAAASLLVASWWPGRPLAALHIEPAYIVLLALGVLLRAAADYAALLLLAFGGDNQLIRSQLIAVAFGALVLSFASWRFGLPGAVAGALGTPLVYYLINRVAVRRIT